MERWEGGENECMQSDVEFLYLCCIAAAQYKPPSHIVDLVCIMQIQ